MAGLTIRIPKLPHWRTTSLGGGLPRPVATTLVLPPPDSALRTLQHPAIFQNQIKADRPQAAAAWMGAPLALMMDSGYTGGPPLSPGMQVATMIMMGAVLLVAAYPIGVIAVSEGVSAVSYRVLHRRLNGTAPELPMDIPESKSLSVMATYHYSRGLLALARADKLYAVDGPGAHGRALAEYRVAHGYLQKAMDHFINNNESRAARAATAEGLGRIHLRLGELEKAIEMVAAAARDHEFMGHYPQAALLELQAASLLDREDAQSVARAVTHYSHAIQIYKQMTGIAVAAKDEDRARQAALHREYAESQVAQLVRPLLDDARRDAEGLTRYAQWVATVQVRTDDHENTVATILSPRWLRFAALAWMSGDALVGRLNSDTKPVFERYDRLRQQMESLHGRLEAARAAFNPAVTPQLRQMTQVLTEMMQDWIRQIPALQGQPVAFDPVHLPDPQREMARLEEAIQQTARDLENPDTFQRYIRQLLGALWNAGQQMRDRDAVMEKVGVALTAWIGAHPGWAGTLIDILLNDRFLHPDLSWQTLGELAVHHASWFSQEQISRFRDNATIDADARRAWQRGAFDVHELDR